MKEIESAATILSYVELQIMKRTTYQPIINRLRDLENNPDPRYNEAIELFAMRLAGLDYQHSERRVKGISYAVKKNRYTAEKTFNGVKHFIKASIHFEVAYEALKEFCQKHEIPLK